MQKWIQNGCNGFEMKSPISNPMSFWTEQDVLLYIKMFDIKICSVYGDVVNDDGTEFDPSGYDDNGIFELDRPCLKTTGCQRTGCVFCGFGCHLDKKGEGRFERLKETHPQLYDYVFNDGIFVYEIKNRNGSEIDVRHCEYNVLQNWVEKNRDNPNFIIHERYVPDRGLGYKYVIDWLNEYGNLNIRY